jgi:acyl carrier protein phosphodiesterase
MNAIKDKVNVILSKSKEELKELSYKYKMKTKHNREILLKVFWKKSLSKIWSYINE